MRLITLLAAAAIAVSGAAAPDPQPAPIPEFEDEALELAENRVLPGTGNRDPLSGVIDWDALWDAYLAERIQTCRDTARGELAAARCNLVVIDNRADPDAPTAPITMADLARFMPVVGELVVEPDGWGVVGTPTNFYATAETHTMDGELFDIAIQVRWTPTSYRFDYGDGTVEETEAAGSAWRGTEESWTETATSHTYSTRDDVTASVTVVFTAEVDAGSGWFAVPGTLPVEAPATPVKVFEVDTVLTDGDCMANPSAAGCG